MRNITLENSVSGKRKTIFFNDFDKDYQALRQFIELIAPGSMSENLRSMTLEVPAEFLETLKKFIEYNKEN